MKKVLIFGSTGSIGRNSLDVIKRAGRDFKVLGLCVNSDIKGLKKQIKEFKPEYVCVANRECGNLLEAGLDKGIKVFKGDEGLETFASIRSDIAIMGISGIFCLKPLLISLRHSRRIALANKESIVAAAPFVFEKAQQAGVEIIPVDSEINALFQLFNNRRSNFSKVYITASGGALIDYKRCQLKKVGIREVLSHPNWKMGRRITVDCATLVNKAFEVIEAHRFFSVPYEKIGVIIHRESVMHALVELEDNTVFACCYPPDMKTPIAYALYYPIRPAVCAHSVFGRKFSLSFEGINYNKYPLFTMIMAAARKEDNSLIALNACDETAVKYFLAGKIKFTDIYKAMDYIFTHYPVEKIKEIKDVYYWDEWARRKTEQYINKFKI